MLGRIKRRRTTTARADTASAATSTAPAAASASAATSTTSGAANTARALERADGSLSARTLKVGTRQESRTGFSEAGSAAQSAAGAAASAAGHPSPKLGKIGGLRETPGLRAKDPLAWAVAVVNKDDLFERLRRDAGGEGGAAPAIQFGKETTYDPSTHTIEVKRRNGMQKADALHELVFELCNSTQRQKFQQLERLARGGKVDPIAYAVIKETLEYESECMHDREIGGFFDAAGKLGRADELNKTLGGVRPSLAQCLYNKGNRSDNLKVQVELGHAGGYFVQWLGVAGKFAQENPTEAASLSSWLERDKFEPDELAVDRKLIESMVPGVSEAEVDLVKRSVFFCFNNAGHLRKQEKDQLRAALKPKS